MKQLMIALCLIGLVLLAVSPAMAGQGSGDAPVNLRLTSSAAQGNPGAQVTVSGSGADTQRNVVITLAPQADSAANALITEEVVPAADGTFSAVITLPSNAPDGVYALRAEQFTDQGFVLQYYWNTFTVGAGGSGPFLPVSGAVAEPPSGLVPALLALLLVAGLLGRAAYLTAME